LDTSEVVVAMNLSTEARDDCVLVDGDLTPPGTELRDGLGHLPPARVGRTPDGTAFVRVPLAGRQMAILVATGDGAR